MRQLDLYLFRTVAGTMLLALFALVGILTIFMFLEQVEDVANEYTLAAALKYCIYSVPRTAYEIIPFAAMIGCLAGLGLLASSSELVVMRAAGISTWSIALRALQPALLLVLLALVLGEFFLPDIERKARNDRTQAISTKADIAPFFGFWYREGDVFMHFDEVSQSGELGGVSHYYFDEENRMQRALFAERAVFQETEAGSYWIMEGVTTTDFGPDKSIGRQLPTLRWNSNLRPDLISTEILVEPDKMSITELRAKIDYLEKQGLNTKRFELGFWQKSLQPLATLALVFVAISFVFGPLREATMGMRVVSGLLLGVLFKFLQDLLSPASLVYGFSPFIAIVIPILLCFAMGYYLLRRAS